MIDLSRRLVQTEILDHLDPADPRAQQSRKDLQKLNFIMGHNNYWRRFFGRLSMDASIPWRCCEVGCGDGSLTRHILSCAGLKWPQGSEWHLLDRSPALLPSLHPLCASHGCALHVIQDDLQHWIQNSPHIPHNRFHLVFMNLFLHHFSDHTIQNIWRGLSSITDFIICMEPARSRLAWIAAQACGLIGCNSVTRHDAPISVQAGFRQYELTQLWRMAIPDSQSWTTQDMPVGLFSHVFLAHRNIVPHPVGMDQL